MLKHITLCLFVIFVCLRHSLGYYDNDQYINRYKGYKIVEVRASDPQEFEHLRRLQRDDPEIDFWTEVDDLDRPVTFMVSPQHFKRIKKDLDYRGFTYSVKNDNVQRLLQMNLKKKKRKLEDFDLDDFNEYDNIYRWLNETVGRCPSGFSCQVYSIGKTSERRDIPAFRIWKEGEKRKTFWLDATIHAREWLSTATALKILNHVVTSENPSATELREKYDWIVAPILNPDGYVYSHEKERLWRKSRSRSSAMSECIGTDLNRNFDHHWGSDGVSHNPCSQVFCGSSPASEPETKAYQDEMLRLAPTFIATMTLHTYGNMFMFPYGYVDGKGEKCVRSDLHEHMMIVSDASADAIQSVYDTEWKRGSSCEVVYKTSGTSTDFAQGVANISFPFCLELRGDHFIVPPEDIDKSFHEVWKGVEKMLKIISTLYLSK